jgi:adenylosuccinate lyase
MHGIFEPAGRLAKMLDVEAALARAHAEVGNIPKGAAREISKKASLRYVTPKKVGIIRKRVKHGVVAIILALGDACEGKAGAYVHLGATSNDISDTALALQLKDAVEIILGDLEKIKKLLGGSGLAQFAGEIQRSIDRINECKKRLLVGKMSGAVGTFAAFGKKGPRIQKMVMKALGLGTAPVTSQVIQRDRHAEFILNLGILAGTLEKIAREAGTPNDDLGAVVRARALPALECITVEHEGDITSLNYELIGIPEACFALDGMLKSLIAALEKLKD